MISRTSTDLDNLPASVESLPTLIHLLRWRAVNRPEQLAYTFLPDGEGEGVSLTYGELDAQARAIAAMLQSAAAGGDRALLLFPSGMEFVSAFFGCLYAGVIAVPVYPPNPSRLNQTLPRFRAVANDARPVVALTTTSLLPLVKELCARCRDLPPMRWLTTDDINGGPEQEWKEPALTGDTAAFLQYTSGSTSAPKGVIVSHANLLHNERVIREACGHSERSTFVSWLPLYHDMGLIGTLLQPLYLGALGVIMPPTAFLQKPFRWLQAISRYKAATSGGPNFAYDLCVRKVSQEQRATLDLSSWTTAFNGAEPVRYETLERFASAFARCGFRRETFFPCYGLAESTLIVSGSPRETPPITCSVRSAELERNRVVQTSAEGEGARTIVSCGRTLLGQKVVVVNPEDLTRCPPDRVGEIWVSGPSVALGYWNRPEETERTFGAHLADTGEGPFLRTGDLGFVMNGEVFVTGRLKDLIIIRGRNHYPQDIELTVEGCHESLRPGCGAAFSVEAAGEECLVVVQEVDGKRRPDIDEVIGAIRREVAEDHELQVYSISLIEPGSIPKTTSGKIQRRACRQAFLEDGLEVVARWQESLTPEARAQATATARPESASAIEAWLVSNLAAKLRVGASSIAVDEPISHYGLDSLMTIELTHDIEVSLGVILPTADLLQGLTIAQVSDRAFSRLATGNPGARPALAQAEKRDSESPLSYGQQALWFLYKLAPDSAAYNISAAARITSDLDGQALRLAFQSLVDRHPSLRGTFYAPSGEPVQKINDRVADFFHEEDASALSEASIDKRLIEEAHRPFDLQQGPLLRITLFTRAAREHILLLVAHHIAVDFWSLGVLLRELAMLYEAEKGGASAALAPLTLQYTDYVRWQAEMLRGPEGERLWAYWRGQLAGELPTLNLPTDRPRPSVQTYRGASQSFKLGRGLTDELKALARAHNATLYTVLLAAFQVLLHRYSGEEDILVGSPTAGRARAEFRDIVGYFVNPVVLRADLSGDPAFDRFLDSVRQTVLCALSHQDYPFNLLVERLQPDRDPGRPPLFQVMFVFHKAPSLDEEGLASFALGEGGAKIRLGDLSLESAPLRQQIAQFDLTLAMAEAEGGLSGSLQYNTDLFDGPTISRIVENFKCLLTAVVTEPRRQVSQLPLLSESERRLLVEWNQTRADFPDDRCIHQLFEAQAERSPDAVAVVFEGEQISYGELNRRANQLARYLRGQGVGPEARVGVCLERGPEMVVGILGILKAGGAYVPLDPGYPQERLQLMVEDAQAEVLLTERRFAERLSNSRAALLCLDERGAEIAGTSSAAVGSGVPPRNLAYVIYTSGSTGRPKGVAIEHRSASVLMHWAREAFSDDELQCVMASTSICFDLSVFELFVPLSWGGRVLVAGNALSLPQWMGSDQVKLVNTVPSAMAELLRMKGVPSSVRVVNLAGEALHRSLVRQIYEQTRVERVLNLYGPSEDTTYSTYVWLKREEQSNGVPIGRPVANTQAYVLNERYQTVPIGVAGELYLGGEGLARGYLNRPELTAEKFMPDPFSHEAGARMYRTGDQVRWRADGQLDFLGRIDNQVKLRGFRIELGEIESSLRGNPSVRDAAVLLREGEAGEKRLVAYVVASSEQGEDVASLRAYLRQKLPDYMIPAAFMFLEAMPLTPNGKIDRRRLPRTDWPVSGLGEGFTAPRTPGEEMLAGIWSEVLGVERIGIHDNFFELGGHSLMATKVVSRIQDALRIELPLSSLFESPTVAGLSEKIEAAMRAGRATRLPPIERVSRDGRLELSFAQQRLWLLHQLGPGSPAYNIPFVIRLKGPVNAVALEQSVSEIFARHEALRATFVTVDGQPVQIITPAHRLAMPLIDLTHLPESERQAEAVRLAAEESRRPFNLTKGPMLRAKLVRLDGEDYMAVITTHHIASDGWSIEIFARELAALYQYFSEGRHAALPDLPIQYPDFAHWQQEWLRGDALEAQLAYWKRQLSGAPPVLELPADRPRPAVQTFEGDVEAFELSADLSRRLRELSRANGVTLFMTLTAAFNTLICRYSGQHDVVLGTPVANRGRIEVEPLIGFFSNMLVLRTDMSGDPDFTGLLRRVRDVALGAYAHQDLPVEKLVEELQPERSLSHTPLFQVVLALHNDPLRRVEIPGLALSQVPIHNGASKFDLLMNVWEEEGRLVGGLEYSTDLFDAQTIKRMVGSFATLLEGIADDPNLPVSALPLLTRSERKRLLGWNNSARRPRQDFSISQLFEMQVERTPEATAVVFEQDALTYRELNRRANRLAHHLRKLGVGPEVCVALCVERSVEMLVGVLGILKAGGAYVPLDPAYPKERLAYALDDARAPVLVTRREMIGRLPELTATIVDLDSEWAAVNEESEANIASGTSVESPAYVIYTSGSTGKPKGVVVTHSNVTRLLEATRSWFEFNEKDVWTLFHSYAFDFSVWEIWGALLYGGRLVVVPYMTSRTPEAFYELLVREKVTVLNQTPSAFRQLMRVEEGLGGRRELSLNVVIFGGEALELQSLRQWFERHGDQKPRLVNMYGITETTVHVTYRPLRESDLSAGAGSVIGEAIPDLQLLMLDEHLEPVPIGVAGEMYVGGEGLARGYLNRPELTAERFIPNPYGDREGARLYKTGDLARYLPNGELEYLGRTDQQVKVRGYRIELGEIEAAMMEHDAIRESVVTAHEEAGGEKRLIAYLVARGEGQLTGSEMRAYLKEKLPDHMVPAAFVMMEAFPLTANGKVDRRALPLPGGERPALESPYVEPHTETEKVIAAVWRQVLHVEKVGRDDNFFDLGGDSFLMAQACGKLREALDRDISMVEVFTYTSVGSLAIYLTRAEVESAVRRQSGAEVEARRESMKQREQFRKRIRVKGKP
ncbi:MAG TPA: amino acid adenylation domain-containing protein [Blastocatellia bacterium]|nr:amino acid adenylation domain-containing protein [Blastocatellia bacterium]